ncbi:hypothetical protein NC651_033206 [Populus alba x Populus x berolinensis]|nr:hypothetical protein NC651_033206 [Populus alba x Populus x berolinensis]
MLRCLPFLTLAIVCNIAYEKLKKKKAFNKPANYFCLKKERKVMGEKLLNFAIESYKISYEEMITYSNDIMLIASQIRDSRRRC